MEDLQALDGMFRRALTPPMPSVHTTANLAPTVGSWLLYGGRLLANVPATVTVTPAPEDPDPLDFAVTMELDIVAGRLSCVSLKAERMQDGPPITSEGLRRVPVAEYVMAAELVGHGILRERSRQPDGSYLEKPFEPPPPNFADNGMTDEALEQVARIFAMSQATGRPATGILLNDYGMPRPTATRWIQAARRRGILREDHRRVQSGAEFGVQPSGKR